MSTPGSLRAGALVGAGSALAVLAAAGVLVGAGFAGRPVGSSTSASGHSHKH
jgi:hypothetical protein